jgi:hypothetical protein
MNYNENYSTDDNITSIPGPLIEVTIANFFNESLITKDVFLIDSGADKTLIRKQIFEVLDLEIYGEVMLRCPTDKETDENLRQTCLIFLEIPQIKMKERFEVVINTDNEENLLGRDFLNYIKLLLDGPNQQFTIIES